MSRLPRIGYQCKRARAGSMVTVNDSDRRTSGRVGSVDDTLRDEKEQSPPPRSARCRSACRAITRPLSTKMAAPGAKGLARRRNPKGVQRERRSVALGSERSVARDLLCGCHGHLSRDAAFPPLRRKRDRRRRRCAERTAGEG
jgi:hypothetical protein